MCQSAVWWLGQRPVKTVGLDGGGGGVCHRAVKTMGV